MSQNYPWVPMDREKLRLSVLEFRRKLEELRWQPVANFALSQVPEEFWPKCRDRAREQLALGVRL